MEKCRCYICGGNAFAKSDPISTSALFECEACGRFMRYMYEDDIDRNVLASFLYYNCKISLPIADKKYYYFLGTNDKFEKIQKENPCARLVTRQEVEDWYPQTFDGKIDKILLGLSKLSKPENNPIKMTNEQYYSAFFVKRYNSDGSETTSEERNKQIKFIENYLLENKFIEGGMDSSITLLPEGFKRITGVSK